LAHRAFCTRLIFLRPAADMVRRFPLELELPKAASAVPNCSTSFFARSSSFFNCSTTPDTFCIGSPSDENHSRVQTLTSPSHSQYCREGLCFLQMAKLGAKRLWIWVVVKADLEREIRSFEVDRHRAKRIRIGAAALGVNLAFGGPFFTSFLVPLAATIRSGADTWQPRRNGRPSHWSRL
jgi:hypothetical protein